jgi:threonine dehydratase
MAAAVGIDDVRAAARRIASFIHRTPLLPNQSISESAGFEVRLKCENLQRAGSFKIRGAMNALLQLSDEQRKRGVVAFSSGNHAQGVAAAAQLLGIPATIVMPADAPAIKLANTRGYGADVVVYDRRRESREAIAARVAGERGASLIPPYDDVRVIAGQGTVGLELAEQAEALGVRLDAVIVPAGGGGLVAGTATAVTALSPTTKVYSAEPQGFDDHRRSLAEGRRLENDPDARSICDALQAPQPGEITFAINHRLLAGGLAVSDAEVRAAMRIAFADYKLVVEPGGAAALAAALSSKLALKGKTVAVVASGGNVDANTFTEALRAAS